MLSNIYYNPKIDNHVLVLIQAIVFMHLTRSSFSQSFYKA